MLVYGIRIETGGYAHEYFYLPGDSLFQEPFQRKRIARGKFGESYKGAVDAWTGGAYEVHKVQRLIRRLKVAKRGGGPVAQPL